MLFLNDVTFLGVETYVNLCMCAEFHSNTKWAFDQYMYSMLIFVNAENVYLNNSIQV